MRKLEDEIRCASCADTRVMLSGESGVGKRFAADTIHHLSPRHRAPFVVCHAKDFEAENPRVLQIGENGTVLIQEIEKVSTAAQLQMLRFIEESMTDRNNVRFMTATGINLFERVERGEFHEDLFYRLNVIHLVIPPLRERREDIPAIFHHYLSLHARNEAPQLSSAARKRLEEYQWPGNIRELRAVTKTLGTQELPNVIEPAHLPCPIGE
jgi:DNA-binding NtrC family response regulator